LKRPFSGYFIFVVPLAVFCSCGYKQNLMFTVPEGQELTQRVAAVEKNYIIQRNDYLELDVYTNKGERIIDPDLELTKDLPNQSIETKPNPSYLVDIRGVAKFPMVGEVKIEGTTIREAEAMLQQLYSEYYRDAFVVLRYVNKRVIHMPWIAASTTLTLRRVIPGGPQRRRLERRCGASGIAFISLVKAIFQRTSVRMT
jgi:polysaccharide export outer membrane protein